jgi:hypothetical protein
LKGETWGDITRHGHTLLGVEELGEPLEDHPTTAIRKIHRRSDAGQRKVNRLELFARDEHRCVYCGVVQDVADLSVDHVQPRVRGGDGSHGNVVTACRGCNTLKASRSLAHYLAEHPAARRNFFLYARYVYPRHLRSVAEELARRGVGDVSTELVEEIRGPRRSEAIET